MTFPLNVWCAAHDVGDEHPIARRLRDNNSEIVRHALADEDQACIDAIRAGDAVVYDRLVVRYWGPLCAFASGYVKDAEIAKELVADVFAAVWERRAEWTVRTTVEAYLFGAVRNRARTAHRDLTRRTALLDAAVRAGETPALSTSMAADLALDHADLVQRVHAAIDALPPRLREVTRLRWEQHMEYDAIAEVLDVSTVSARQLVSRALRLLRQALAE